MLRQSESRYFLNPLEMGTLQPKKTSIFSKRASFRSISSISTGNRTPILNQNNLAVNTNSPSANLGVNGNNEEALSSTNSSTRVQNASTANYLNPSSAALVYPFRFLPRDSISSRRDSFFQMPDLLKQKTFSTNVFHSFQSQNSTSLAWEIYIYL